MPHCRLAEVVFRQSNVATVHYLSPGGLPSGKRERLAENAILILLKSFLALVA